MKWRFRGQSAHTNFYQNFRIWPRYFNLGGIQTSFQHINSFTGYSFLLCDHWLCCCGLRFLTVYGCLTRYPIPHRLRYTCSIVEEVNPATAAEIVVLQ